MQQQQQWGRRLDVGKPSTCWWGMRLPACSLLGCCWRAFKLLCCARRGVGLVAWFWHSRMVFAIAAGCVIDCY
jgi:hypothetical protein